MNRTIDSYNRSAASYESKFLSYKPYINAIQRFTKYLKPGDCVFDIGCGPGINARICLDNGLKFKGIDLSSEMIELAKARCPEGEFAIQDVNNLDLNDKYEAVIASFIIVHLDDNQMMRLIDKISNILKPSGYLYISFMTGKKAGYEFTSFSQDGSFYYNYYSIDNIKNLLGKHNLEVVEEFHEDYKEKKGSITEDVFLVSRKS